MTELELDGAPGLDGLRVPRDVPEVGGERGQLAQQAAGRILRGGPGALGRAAVDEGDASTGLHGGAGVPRPGL